MSQRKLQQEIDRVFKKVKEGLEEFDFIYDKLQSSDSQSQKEKLENDLKREIKKLQRSREQIKNWMSGNEVKEKKQLIEHRRLIEVEMERFKEVEKIMKTKAFSKEGLSQHKIDPKEQEKIECANFVQSMIEELERQNEALEAQIEQLQGTGKKGKKADSSKQAQIAEYQELLSRHAWHTDKLENILRLLENGNLDIDQVNSIQEDIQYYVESNQDDNFVEDDTFYDELGLDELDESFRFAAVNVDGDDDGSGDEKEEKDTDSALPPPINVPKTLSRQPSMPVLSSTPSHSESISRKVSLPISSTTSTHLDAPTASSLRMSAASTVSTAANPLVGALKPATPITTPKLKYASVAAAVAANGSSSPAPSHSSMSTPNGSVAQLSSATPLSQTQLAQGQTFASALAANVNTAPTTAGSSPAPSAPPGLSRVVSSLSAEREATASPVSFNVANGPSSNILSPKLTSFFSGFNTHIEALQSGLEKLQSKQAPTLASIFPYLESSLLNCPDSYDSDVPVNYLPVNPWTNHLSFPQEPAAEIVESRKLLTKLDLRTLFYCFYYHNHKYQSTNCGYSTFDSLIHGNDGDYLQFIAAQELHSRGWKYHKSLKTWFIEGDNEGTKTWNFFDFKTSWTIQRKTDFVFEVDQEESSFF